MEGMISDKVLEVQVTCATLGECTMSLDNWDKGLVIKLLEATHGQWLYIHVLVRNEAHGVAAAQRKELLQLRIERQIELGEERVDT